MTHLIIGQVLSLFGARTQIQHNIQQIGEIHERFQGRLQQTSPLSSRQAAAEASDFVARGLSKRLGGIDLRGLKGLPNRSLRTRSFKAAVDQHRKSQVADPVEVLEVAREIEKLVSSKESGPGRVSTNHMEVCIFLSI